MLPPLSVLLPLNKNLEEKFAVLQAGPHCPAEGGYNTLKQAQDDGAVVMAYGYVLSLFFVACWLGWLLWFFFCFSLFFFFFFFCCVFGYVLTAGWWV
jgi:large conductance mechanosensitive channel